MKFRFLHYIEEFWEKTEEQTEAFFFWFDNQDENTQSFVTLIFALLMFLLYKSAIK